MVTTYIYFLRLTNKLPQTEWLETTEICCQNSGGSTSGIKVSSFWWLPAILGVPCLVDTWLQLTPLSSRGVLPVCHCVFVSKLPSDEDTSDWSRAHPTPVWPHLTLIMSVETFPNKVTFTGIGVRISTHLFEEHSLAPNITLTIDRTYCQWSQITEHYEPPDMMQFDVTVPPLKCSAQKLFNSNLITLFDWTFRLQAL